MSTTPTQIGDTPATSAILEPLVEAGVIEPAAARRAAQVAQATGESAVSVLHQLALADDGSVAAALAARFGVPLVASSAVPSKPVALAGLSPSYLRRRRVLPLALDDAEVMVGVVDPTDEEGLRAVGFAANRTASPRLMAHGEWRKAFEDLYGADAGQDSSDLEVPPLSHGDVWADDAAKVRDQSEAAPAVRLVDVILERALEEGASDIHVEPLPDRVRVRFRVDGELKIALEEAAHLAAPIAARIKILANMDVADRRAPQDGRTSLAAKGRPVDVRISTVPSSYGETVALRLLRRDPALLDLVALGFAPPLLSLFEKVLALKRGLFLVTGPTGSGKTTTLYAMLQRLRTQPLKILSIEDPIEYYFADITQTQVNEEAGLTFATALRSFLRQDPDVILVGEIRDSETARIAIQAALTGHLVLATLHTSDAPGAVSRLVDMGVDRYLVGATLVACVSQRLARRLCPLCRRARDPTPSELNMLAGEAGPALTRVFHADGCPSCHGKGVRGRIAIAEGFVVSDEVREAIADPAGTAIYSVLRRIGFSPLLAEAGAMAQAGEVDPVELRALFVG